MLFFVNYFLKLEMNYRKVEQIRESIEKMQKDVEEVKKIHSSILSAPQTDNSMNLSIL